VRRADGRRDAAVRRSDRLVASEPGVAIHVRHVAVDRADLLPLVLVHGGGPGGVASFDLPVPGASVAEALARAGHPVHVMDVRGWGGSTRPAAMAAPASDHAPAVSSDEAARDIAAVVADVCDRLAVPRIGLIGWATGGHWCALHACRDPGRVSHLVLLNSLYGIDAPWGMRAAFEADDEPGVFDRGVGAYALRTAAGLLGGWDRSIPAADKTLWRDPAVADAYVREALASDPDSRRRTPPAMRVPSGFQLDSYRMSRGWRPWEASAVRAATLIVRGELDFWSRDDDVTALERELVGAARVEIERIPQATHYLMLDRPERGRQQFLDRCLAFLSDRSIG
jgi:pimeloyl-ACP methyl ester carboxylesterase